MKKRMLALTVAGLTLMGMLSGCFGGTASPSPTPSEEPTASVQPSPEPVKTEVHIAMLNGPTGMGAAKLMADAEAGETIHDYRFTVYTDNTEVVNDIAKGDLDIAALATNVAANLYNKTEGVQLIAINTYGVLKILQNGEEADITSMADLAGQTVYAVGQGANPEYVLNYLLRENDLEPGTDVDIQWMTAEEVLQGLLSGKTKFAMLPVPAATTAQIKGEGKVRQVLDLSEQWDAVTDESKLTMGCVVVRKAFAEEHPDVVRDFLGEYEASIAYMTDEANMALSSELNPGQLLEKYGIVPSAAVGGKALPQANLTFVSGVKDLRDTIQGYYEVLFAAEPTSIGGGIPDDAFYFE